MNLTWTPERVEILSKLWHTGMSARLIGAALDVSRNAVLGKAHRMNLGVHLSPLYRRAPAAPISPECFNPDPVTAPELPRERPACAWIHGDRGVDFARYADARRCGETAQLGSSYCAKHHDICWKKRETGRAA